MNSFTQLIGQKQAVELLQQAVAKNRIAPAYLFSGPSGVGRSLAAKCFSQLLMCSGIPGEKHPLIEKKLRTGNHPDLLWVQPTYLHQGKRLSATEAAEAGLKRKAPPQIRIEQIREITQFLARPPLEASRSVVIIEDTQTMAEAAANALLKTLEEPGRATLILIAPGTDSLLPTLVSRCQRIPFYRLAYEDMKQVLWQNGYEAILENPAVFAIAQGSPGEAILSWQQLQAIPESLLEKLKQPPKSSLNALNIAKEVDKELDTQAQLWLVDYLQYNYWDKSSQRSIIELLEEARKFLLSYAQPRLVWECTLLKIYQNFV
ncbi:MAG: DNA polymerase III subunit delta' [Moorea sp. SIO2B7]|nr:DNA polymerase III subunit delta' [Moorena sp. SIO2B7]